MTFSMDRFQFVRAFANERRKGTSFRRPLAVESLEGRALLSHLAHGPHAAAALAGGQPFAARPFNHPGPVFNEIGPGYAVKQPRFYAGYTGPLRAELNLAAATASLDGAGDLILSTEAAGQIPVASTASKGAGAAASTIASSYYVFAINTGNANGPGLYPGRPNIVFDTAVTVSSTPAGVTGSIVSPNNPNGAPIALPVGSLHVNHDTIKVVVPLNLLPAGSLSPSQWRVTAFARNNPPAADFQSIASFAPDFTMFQVSKSPRALIL